MTEKKEKTGTAAGNLTSEERENPELLKKQTSRIARIAKGAGVTTTEIRSLLKQYDMLNETCDIHWLRMRIYYECGILPDVVTIANPYIYIGFYDKLLDTKCLDNLMLNPNVCFEAEGIRCRAYTDITPQALQDNMLSASGYKTMYFSNGTRVEIIFSVLYIPAC